MTTRSSKLPASRPSNGWTVVSDTSWPGYERIPGLVMQGYTAMVREALRQLDRAADACLRAGGRRRRRGGCRRPSRASCSARSGRPSSSSSRRAPPASSKRARAGQPVKIAHGEPTVMAMLECYEPSPRRLAGAGAGRRRLHDGRRGRCRRDDAPACTARRRRSGDRRRRERRRRPGRADPRRGRSGYASGTAARR